MGSKISMPQSFFEPDGQSVFNPALRFAFTNITEEVFTSHWNKEPIVVQPHQTVELPHHLAVKLTRELVDNIMIGDAKLDELTKNQPYYRSPKGASLGVPAARAVWEEQIVRQLQVDEESPEMQVMKIKIKEELQRDMAQENAETNIPIPTSTEEFAQIKKEGEAVKVEAPKKPMRVKVLKEKK